MVEINLDHRRPPGIIDRTGIKELTEWGTEDGQLRIGAGVSYARIIDELGSRLPGLAMASRTVGSPQIRNRGTVGGNLGTASPAGDAHPPLLASSATVELASTKGTRRLPIQEFFTGPQTNAIRPGELISAFLGDPATGPSTTCAARPTIAVTRWPCWAGARSDGRGTSTASRNEGQLQRERSDADGRGRVGGRKPPLHAARTAGSVRNQERLRAGRVRVV